MNPTEMMQIRGGRRAYGPGKVEEADIEIPDLTYQGPGGVQEADVETPDLTLGGARIAQRPAALARRFFF